MPYVTFSYRMLFSAVGVLFLRNCRKVCVCTQIFFVGSSACPLRSRSHSRWVVDNTRCTRSIERKRSQHTATHPLGRFVNMAHCGLSVCRALQSEVIGCTHILEHSLVEASDVVDSTHSRWSG